MQTKNNNVVVVSCPPCGERACPRRFLSGVALATKRGAYKAISLMSPSIGPAGHFLRKGGRLGFTLIELLVVVLIIGILAAVAVPQYQKTIERSKATEAMSMLSSIAKAYQTYYLANGTYATKFEQLDVDISFTEKTKVMDVSSNNGDTKSNKNWSFQLQNHSTNSGYISIFATRIDGKYKGAGFSINFDNPSHNADKHLKCFERKSAAAILFDTNLPEGSYCERIMQSTKFDEDEYSRKYTLP